VSIAPNRELGTLDRFNRSHNISVLCWAATLFLYLEGDSRDTEGRENYCELRITGPDINQMSPKSVQADRYVIDVLVVNIKSDKNIFIFDGNIGLVTAAFTNSITVFKYGTGSEDNPDANNPLELGCLKLFPDPSRDRVQVTRFGQRKPNVRLQEATIEAGYEMLLSL
jgi:hypothetical protein